VGDPKSPSQVFLSYAREDRETVEILYQKLSAAGFKPWMDTRDILPGEVWMESIRSAIEHSDFFLACLSPNSVNKRGVLQREFKAALDTWQGMLESDIYFIPVKLADCAVPEGMRKFQWVDLYEPDGFLRLEEALRKGSEQRRAGHPSPVQRPGSQAAPGRKWSAIENWVMRTVRSARSKPVSFLGSILGLLAAITGLPWVFNNFLYSIPRPAMPAVCQVSPAPVRVGIAPLPGCPDSFQGDLADSWVVDWAAPSMIPQASDPSQLLSNYDIVVRGSCENLDSGSADLTFELITSRVPFGVYQPSSLQVTGSLDELSGVGQALMRYQQGDYVNAATLFGSLPILAGSKGLALFEANSLLLAERYDDSISSYEAISTANDLNSAAALNNMGVAYFNQDTDLGLDEFNRSIELAEDQDASGVEAMALINRSRYFLLRSDWEKASADCSSLLTLNGQSALPYVCMASYNFISYRFQPPGVLPLREINRNLIEAEKYADAPALLHYLRGDMNKSHFWQRKQDAVDAYHSYLTEMQYQACLQMDRTLISTAREQIQNLTRP
jgi:hypothetical protein